MSRHIPNGAVGLLVGLCRCDPDICTLFGRQVAQGPPLPRNGADLCQPMKQAHLRRACGGLCAWGASYGGHIIVLS